uniref:Uncharacterized protein n=1 Tax=Arundo donax TaxID=35708 RepID=A0A0A9FJS4_ARUDO
MRCEQWRSQRVLLGSVDPYRFRKSQCKSLYTMCNCASI